MSTEAPLILVVDDDADFQEMNRQILESGGYRVVCCSNPEEALAKMSAAEEAACSAEAAPALVITDLMMESLDAGFSFARRVKEDPRWAALPIVVVTAVTSQRGFDFQPRTPEDLEAMHADAFFGKPVEPKALLKKVRELLEARAGGSAP